MSDKDISNLNPDYKKYSSLFSDKFMQLLHIYLLEKDIIGSEYHSRNFCVLGRTLNVGNLSIDNDLDKNMSLINSRKYLSDKEYSVNITYDGILNIYYGNSNSMAKVLIPKEKFIYLKEKSFLNKNKRKYDMLANLQGKNLLN
jgi:hypothetical protein